MTDFRDVPVENRFEQGFTDADGQLRRVWAEYALRGEDRVILHVEADAELRGTGAAGDFMKRLTEHARAEGFRMIPQCSYAVAWHRRHPDTADVVAEW